MQDLFLALDTLTRKAAREDITTPSALRVARRVLLARIDPAMDRLARLSFLEGVAVGNLGVNLKPGTWIWKGNAGWKDAEKYFKDLNPAWMSKSNQGFFEAARSGVGAVLGHGAAGDGKATVMFGSDIDAIVSDHMQGVQPFSGNRIKPVFYEVGLTLLGPNEVEGLQDGETTPSTAGIRGAIRQKFKARTKTLVSMYKAREKQMGQRLSPTTKDNRPLPGLEGEGLVMNPLYQELRKPSSPLADKIRGILKVMAQKTGKIRAEIFAAYLDLIKGQAFGATSGGNILPRGWATEVGEATGKPENQVRDAVKYVNKWLIANAQKHPLWKKLKQLAAHIGAIGELGLASRFAKTAEFDSMFSEWLAAEHDACGCEDEDDLDDDLEILGEQTKTVGKGPFTLTTVKFPEAPRGGYRHATVQKVADRWSAKTTGK